METARSFLPTSAKEVAALGWETLDVILFTADAYVDHPAFGAAVIGRTLQEAGYRVAIVPQPNWRDDLRDFRKLGTPRLFFGVTGGAMDSMVNHYTANLRLRSDDAYTPGGKAGFRPDRAVSIYSSILKRLFPHTPVVAGGIEASLRRLTHYDYWSDRLMPSILVDSAADLLLYGMGEEPILEVARALHNGFNAKRLRKIRQVAYLTDTPPQGGEVIRLNSYAECVADGRKFGENFVAEETLSNRLETTQILVEEQPEGRFVVVNPPFPPMSSERLDRTYALPYTRLPHPRYAGKPIPAWEMIRHSVTLHRGCFGGCSFCTISAHQGKFIASRSEASILQEIIRITQMPSFRGTLSDLGGPSANMYRMAGRERALCLKCARPSCLWPKRCANLDNDHRPLLALYASVRAVKGIKKAFIGSGIRYDLFPERSDYLREVIVNHTSGRLKVAPEHTENHVLAAMRKPPFALFEKLHDDFRRICRDSNLKYQLIPYFISSHPGCSEADMQALARITKPLHILTEQVQDFTPTPMTLSSVIYHTGIDPYTGKRLYVARNQTEKRRQKGYFTSVGKAAGK